jgi:hypothetical protein
VPLLRVITVDLRSRFANLLHDEICRLALESTTRVRIRSGTEAALSPRAS